jgi:hypothetical protein
MPSAAGSHCARVKDAFRQVMLMSRGSLVVAAPFFCTLAAIYSCHRKRNNT